MASANIPEPNTGNGSPSPKKRNRETILLILVGVFGLAGIGILQFSRKSTPTRGEDRSMVQTNPDNAAANTDTKSTVIQHIPGNLIRENEQPEAGRPFLFEMSNFSQGAEYELDLGDGSRKSFKDGKLRHTYARPGRYQVTLFARFEGQEVRLQSVTKQVAQAVKEEKAITPIIDY